MAKFYSLQFGSGDPRTYTGLSPTFIIFVRMTDGATISPPAITESLAASGLYQFTFGTTQPISFLADAATTSPGTAGRYVSGQIDPADRADEYGATLVAIGMTLTANNTALSSTLVAIGNTSIAYGGTILGQLTSTGATLVGIGNTSIALGSTVFALSTNAGVTAVAFGNTSIAIGTTLIAIGNSLTAQGLSNAVAMAGIGSTASLIGDSATDPTTIFGYLKRIAELEQGQETFVKGTGALTMFDRTGATTLANRTVTNNASLVIKT